MAPGDAAEREARVHRALSHVARVRMVQLLEQTSRTVSELAGATGLHGNTVRSHLEVLVRAGLVVGETDERGRPGRPSVRYRMADPPPDGAAKDSLTRVLAEALRDVTEDPGDVAERTGRPWGRALVSGETSASDADAVRRVVVELAELGFAPELQTDSDRGQMNVLLHRCPFDDLARTYGDAVCSAHLGLVRGALEELGASVAADLKPFGGPTVCVTRLTVLPPST